MRKEESDEVFTKIMETCSLTKGFYSELKTKIGDSQQQIFDSIIKRKDKILNDIKVLEKMIEESRPSIIENDDEFLSQTKLFFSSWLFKNPGKKFEEKKSAKFSEIVDFGVDLEKGLLLVFYGLKENFRTSIAVLEDIIQAQKEILVILQSNTKEVQTDIDELLYLALESELLAKRFYERAVEKAESKRAKEFFKTLAEFEQGHFKRVKNIIEDRKAQKTIHSVDVESTYFSAKPEVEGEIEPNKGEIADVLILAIDAEKNAYKKYKEIAALIDDDEGKKIFKSFADSEKTHQRILEDEFYSLSNNGMFL